MSKVARVLFLFGIVPAVAACSSSGALPGGGAPATPHARTAVDGRFAHYLVSPRGDVDGAVLDDGTIARFAPGALAVDAPPLQAGDVIHVEGDALAGPSGRVLNRAAITKGNVLLTRADGPPRPPPPPRGPHGPRGPRGEEAGLQPMTITAKIQAFSTDPRGRIDGIVLDDGTSARGGRKAHLDGLGLNVGDTITVTGRGAVYPQGKSMHVETVKLPSGEVRTVERPLPADRDEPPKPPNVAP